jgi:gamma-tubulin complex component 5
MAQNAKVAALTDELIQSILNFDPAANRQAYKHAREVAARGLKGHQYARTNQFDVMASFVGLDEKFRVKNRDHLADALQARLQKLHGFTSKFKPDFLSLLLRLADRPLENTDVKALELLRPPSPPPPLTWSEILLEDPYSDDEIWKDIDYGADSSADEKASQPQAYPKASPPTNVDEDDTYYPEGSMVLADTELVTALQKAQFWKSEEAPPIDITELQAVRETLHMLAGLRTHLYQIEEQQYNVRIVSRYRLGHAMPGTAHHLLSAFTAIGRDILQLRRWTMRPTTTPLVQTFQAAVRKRLLLYDQALSQLQQRYLIPNYPVAVSLLEVHDEVRSMSVPILRLAQMVANIEPNLLINPFSHLEALFDRITLSQMVLEGNMCDYMSGIFFESLQTYLKPIRQWMEEGELGVDNGTFFIFANDSGCDVASLWHDRFVLRFDGQHRLRAPKFLQPAAKRIFDTGKSVVFLKELGIQDTLSHTSNQEVHLDQETVFGLSGVAPLSPFPETLQAAFDRWIGSKYSMASKILRQHIFETDDLMHILDAFETVYLGKNGALFEEFAVAVFERMDASSQGWNDRYVLTELARSIYSPGLSASNVEKIVVRPMRIKSQNKSAQGLATVSIDFAVCRHALLILYICANHVQLPWSLQNIIQRSSILIYQQIFTLLLQIYRVKYLLQVMRPERTQTGGLAPFAVKYRLRHRLIWFTDMLRSYLTETVVFMTTRDLREQMAKAVDMDEMSQLHTKYVAKLQERALLSKDVKPIYEAVVEVLDLGVLFVESITNSEGIRGRSTNKKRLGKPVQRRSNAPDRTMDTSSDSDDVENDSKDNTPKPAHQTSSNTLHRLGGEFDRLLPFITAGLKNVGRVGSEPLWEQLAERLQWEGRKDRI